MKVIKHFFGARDEVVWLDRRGDVGMIILKNDDMKETPIRLEYGMRYENIISVQEVQLLLRSEGPHV